MKNGESGRIDVNENQNSGKRLCRLCGKQREDKEFTEFTLTVIGKMPIRYTGCKSCDVVIHNASILIREAILRGARELNPGRAQEQKIIVP
jgi:hypothetical protein